MLEENKNQLENLMNSYETDLQGMMSKKQAEKAAQDEFAKQFEAIKTEIIWPVIVDVGNQLNQYGHDYHVSEQTEYLDATAVFHAGSITLNIYPAILPEALHKPESTPYISFVADRYAQKVGVMVSTMMPGQGGSVGSHGYYPISDITKDFVEKEMVDVLKNAFIFRKAS
ncbi:MAG: hypothetical protein WCI57_02445 [Candidatus Berkelbacteria bacterium]